MGFLVFGSILGFAFFFFLESSHGEGENAPAAVSRIQGSPASQRVKALQVQVPIKDSDIHRISTPCFPLGLGFGLAMVWRHFVTCRPTEHLLGTQRKYLLILTYVL